MLECFLLLRAADHRMGIDFIRETGRQGGPDPRIPAGLSKDMISLRGQSAQRNEQNSGFRILRLVSLTSFFLCALCAFGVKTFKEL